MKPNRLISFITLLALCVLPIALRGQVLSPPASAKPISEDLKLFAAPSSLSAYGKAGYLAFDANYFYVYNPTTRLWVQLGGGGAGVTDGDKGDVVVSGTGATWLLDTVNSNVGTFGSSSNYVTFTVNAKGLITAATQSAWPTFNQNTTGSAATLTTTRTIGGSNFNGSANITSFPSPGAIGGTTPAAGTFTTLVVGSTADISGTINRSSLDTITITTNAGVVDVTKGDGSATNGANTTLTFSTDNVAATRYLTRTLINSDGSNARVFTFDTATDFTVTVPASSSVVVSMKSQGASGWARVGGASSVVDLSANSAPGITDVVETVNPTTGVSTKSLKVLAGADAGANDTYAVTLSPAITTYSTGQHYRFKANTANTGAATINFNSVGAATIKKFTSASPGADLADNDIRAGQWVDLVYDGTNMQMQSATGNAASGGSWSATSTNVQTQTSLGTTSVSGYTLTNTTAAAAGAQQVSPSSYWIGQGWKTDATAASQEVAFRTYVLPVQGAANPTGNWLLQSAVNGGAMTTRMTVSSAGVLTMTGAGIFGAGVDVTGSYTTSSSGGGFAAGATGGLNWGGTKSYIKSSADGTIELTNFAGTTGATLVAGGLTASSATVGIGYTTGAGGTVTQATSRTTGVTLNKTVGQITLVSAAGSTSWQTFTVTNSSVAANDVIIINQKSGTDLNEIHVTAVGAGSFNVSFKTTGGTTTEQPVFTFAVIKGAAS